jgi:hypothetical protein
VGRQQHMEADNLPTSDLIRTHWLGLRKSRSEAKAPGLDEVVVAGDGRGGRGRTSPTTGGIDFGTIA